MIWDALVIVGGSLLMIYLFLRFTKWVLSKGVKTK